jgi:hypothetical protein
MRYVTLGEVVVASPPAAADSAQDLVPRNPDWALGIEIIEATIEFGALRRRQRNPLGLRGKAVPQFLEEAQPLSRRQ